MDVLHRGGVALHYLHIPAAGRPMVLLHGWCCDHSFFENQTRHFAARGHRVIVPDLCGHGASDAPLRTYSIESFADDIAWLCGELGLQEPILVGHSMGGIIAFDIAVRYPGLASAIIMLDAAIVLPKPAHAAIPAFLTALQGTDYRKALRDFVNAALFIQTDDVARSQSITEAMCRTAQHVMLSAFKGLRDYDPRVDPAGVTLPCLYIAADEPSARTDMERTRQLMPHLQYGQTVGSGHFCQMEVPEQVNAMIDRFLIITRSSAKFGHAY